MNKTKMAELEAELSRMQNGDLVKPVEIKGVGAERTLRKRLDVLRLALLKLKDSEADIERRGLGAIASVAHDMKTPLAVIAGYAESISDGMDDRDYPELIIQKVKQMNDMVLTLIENSHKASEKNAEQKSLQNTRQYFGEVCERLRSYAEPKQIKIKVNKIPDANVRLNSKQFGRVMLNLVTNAVKYSPAGSVIYIKFRLWAKKLYIFVKDEGEGISKEALPYIFDQFFKEDKTRADSSSNGLGLYITKDIVRDHGGNITVRSKKGKGSVFVVSIPVEPKLEDKLTLSGKFDSAPLWQKLLVEFFFGWMIASGYRFLRFFESRNLATFVFAWLCLALFPFMWLIDFLSICVYGRIAFIAD